MSAGGLTFGTVKALLAPAVANGIDPNSSRVLLATNSATKALMDEIIAVNGMATYDVVADGTTLLLPKELENAIEVEVLGMGTVNSNSDVKQGFYTLVNNFTYVDPAMHHDNPLVDQFLQPDPSDPTILRRQYDFPGLTPNSTVRVTGKKRYVPITGDNDYLIIQNPEALKSMIVSQERKYRANDPDGAAKYKADAIQILQAEVKQHLLDPNNSLKRKAAYEADLVNYSQGKMAWVRARLALEIQGALNQGKSELTRILESAERRLMDKGTWKGCLRTYEATVTGGSIYFPAEVQTVLAIDVCGNPIDIRSTFYDYAENGPGLACQCSAILVDQGEDRFTNGDVRRLYKLSGSSTTSTIINIVAKLRWIRKDPDDYMTIQNFEALRLMCMAIIDERNEQWDNALKNQLSAIGTLQDELNDYLRGVKHQLVVETCGFGMQDIGGML